MPSCGKRSLVLGAWCLVRPWSWVLGALVATSLQAQTTDPGVLYQQALRREAVLRQELDATRPGSAGGLLLERIRVLVGSYEDLAKLFSGSEHTDDSLSQGGLLAADAFAKFGDSADRTTAVRLLKSLSTRFPGSPLTRQAAARMKALDAGRPAACPKGTLRLGATASTHDNDGNSVHGHVAGDPPRRAAGDTPHHAGTRSRSTV
jgi:hypothetical protein